MCLLPARSMPGSEMLFVEKTRILGLNPVAVAVDTVSSLRLPQEQLQVAGVVDRTEVVVTHLLAPGRQVLERPGVGGEHFHDPANRDAADGLLGREDRSRARGGPCVDDLIGLQLFELLDCNCHGRSFWMGRVKVRRCVVLCVCLLYTSSE